MGASVLNAWRQFCPGSLLGIAAFVLALFGTADHGFAQRGPGEFGSHRRFSEEGPRFGGGGFRRDWKDSPIDTGFLFIDGQYVAPPYTVALDGDALVINSSRLEVPEQLSLPEDDDDDDYDDDYDGRRRWRRGVGAGFRVAGFLRMNLQDGNVVVHLPGQPLFALPETAGGEALLKQLSTPDSDRRLPEAVLSELPKDYNVGALQQWVTAVEITPELQQRAAEHVAFLWGISQGNHADIAAVQRLDSLAYPLTVVGMLLAVFGLGHLLQHRPPAGSETGPLNPSPETMRMVVRSVGLILAMSILDLVWTILAAQSHQIQELNPLGSQLIEDPLMLTAFKACAVGVTVAILLALRRYQPAQLASWWGCLICTLLTARWLTLNSLFVS